MSPGTPNSCVVCNKSNTRLCNRCKSARYCSTTCQSADFPTHKLLCAVYSTFDTSSRPTDEHFQAILFPPGDNKPKVVWLKCKWYDDDSGRYQLPQTGSFLGPDACGSHTPILYNPVLKRKLSDTICVCYRDTFLIDGSTTNNSIASITATKSGQYHDWRGPIIAYGMIGLGVNQTDCRDIDMNDFRHITDYFLWYNSEHTPATQPSPGAKVEGVKINCLGDRKMFSKPYFEAVEVSSTDPIFSGYDTSEIAKRVGLPIFTRRCLPNSWWANDQNNQIFGSQSPFNNQDATFLHLCCDPKAEFDLHTGILGWGWASKQWQNNVGSTVVVRQDKKPLSPLHVEALCKYCRYEIRPLLAHSIGEYSPEKPMSKDAVLAMICRPTFVIHWYKFLDKKHEEGENTSAPYPYDV